MKTLIFALSTIFTLNVFAQETVNAEPLLVKSSASGFVPAFLVKAKICELFYDKVVVTNISGKLISTKTTMLKIDGNVEVLIKKAAKGVVTEESAPTDGPITSYSAKGEVELKASGSRILENDSEEAATLVNFLDQNC